MHTLLVHMAIDPGRAEQAERHVRDDVIPWATRQPGFISGQWLLDADRSNGMGLIVFASELDATNAAGGPRRYARDENRAWNIDNVTVMSPLASA